MSERTKNLALFAAVLVILDLAAAQAYDRLLPLLEPTPQRVRTLSPVYHHDLQKNVDSWSRWGGRSYPFRTNDLGFLDERVRSVPLCSEGVRLLLMGDSFTEGVGVAFPETFAGILTRELRSQGVEILNAGVVSYSPTIYYRKTRYLIEELGLDIDMLVVFIDGSDVLDESWLEDSGATRVMVEQARRGATATRRPPFEEFKHVLQQYSLIMKAAAKLRLILQEHLGEKGRRARLALDASEVAWDYDPDAYREYGERGLRRAAANMDSLLTLTRRHELPMAVAVYPWPDHIFRRMVDSPQVTFWRAWSRRRGVPFFDLFPAFITERDPEETIREYYIPHDFHWNAAGHRRVAEAVLDHGLRDFIAAALGAGSGSKSSGSCARSVSNPSRDPPAEPAPR
ncbi:MAG TPA: SGNH/GDSL hydrolase family protein [Gemmatimonadota bacterium]|nr:SGNH/GDSL hydrolase family protein [Gemmatimonadota bacterium]